MASRLRLVCLAGLLVSACGMRAPERDPAPVVARSASRQIEPATCVGVITPPSGVTEIDDPELITKALGRPGEGKLCQAKVFRTNVDLRVHRVWDHANPASRLGRWWILSEPKGPVEAYRRANGICRSWSALDRSVACTIAAGATVVFGTGQSARCDDGVEYAASDVTHVFVPDTQVSLRDCSEGTPFP